ncbi:hypothetical protein CKAH01_17012 [Colletotrichum kahawae]|uniref:Uncharacterized protein n=1 Tax=Colletotrichum kahawae TaxID=34407 RepID=A0AAD9YEK4_COLKA|nr:hypothetical protein CKAH01_17012 [Colletotrichum kahawae]
MITADEEAMEGTGGGGGALGWPWSGLVDGGDVQLHLVASGIVTVIPCVYKPTARIDAALGNGNNVAVASPVCQARSFSNLVSGACGSASPVPTTDNAAVLSHTNTPSASRHTAPTTSRRPVIPLISLRLRDGARQGGGTAGAQGKKRKDGHAGAWPLRQSRRPTSPPSTNLLLSTMTIRFPVLGLALPLPLGPRDDINPIDDITNTELLRHGTSLVSLLSTYACIMQAAVSKTLASNRHVHITSQPTNFNLRAKEQASQWVFIRLASGWPAMIMSRHVHERWSGVFNPFSPAPRIAQRQPGSDGLPFPRDSLDLTQILPLADLSDPHCDPYFPMFNAPFPCHWVRDDIFGVRYAVFGFDIQSAGRLGDEEQGQKSANGDSTPIRPSPAWLLKILVHSLAV